MPDFQSSKSMFLQKVVAVIEENLADEHFGVTELAESLSMSRSNLLRKVKQETGESVSVFIRNVRLHNAKQLLKDDAFTVSQISYQVGFNSTSYFTKCFREKYGYTPGNEPNRSEDEGESELPIENKSISKSKTSLIGLLIAVVVATASILFWFNQQEETLHNDLPKSIAVLPFKNDSNDSTNVYFMNGLMGAILENFQKIGDLEVTSRTTIEKYRGINKSIPEMSKELEVSYFVEGSGQKVGNEIVLTVQLIEASSDRPLWSQRYQREIEDVFELQMEVARSIASEINAIITPEENKRIEKIPTENLVAYDYFLKGRAFLKEETGEGLVDGIEQFKKAINEDGEFAQAYAYIAISYFYLDRFQAEKKYTEEIKNYADKANMLDDHLGEGLIAKALYYMQIENYDQAIKSLEEVLVYYPNSGRTHNMLSDIYATIIPNTEKYLQHALKGIRSAVASEDSAMVTITYLHLSNALAQSGFLDEAETYIQKSLDYNPDNIFSQYVYVYIKLGQNYDLREAKASLIEILKKDTNRIDVIQEVAKISYALEDYEEAWMYYEKMIKIREVLQLDLFQSEDVKIGFVLEQLGKKQEAKEYYESYFEYAKNDQSLYKDLSLSAYYAATGNIDKAMNYLKAFSEVDNYQFWFVLFLEDDPIISQMASHPEYKSTIKKINDRFWKNHQRIRLMLEKEKILTPKKSLL